MADRPATLSELKASGYQPVTVKAEIRRNLIRRLRSAQANQEPLFPGIKGYEESVVPQVVNALLCGQDIIFLGERGQAKSRLVRGLANLLDEWIPVLDGAEIPENPYQPVSPQGRALVAEHGGSAPIRWLGRDERYSEKLATPDITIADLIGEVDPIKVAEGRYLADEHTLHYGLVPRTNRGIFAINELPDLAERIQVGLLNLLEERDVQIRGHRVRLPLDVFIVATANPEDYTNRGRIITPLKDRYGAQIRTHYPASIAQEMEIMAQEAQAFTVADEPEAAGLSLHVAPFMAEVIAEITHAARRSPDVNQRSGVSVRASITNYETLTANAARRALTLGEAEVAPRISDLAYILPSFQGKLEIEAMEDGDEARVVARIVQTAVKAVFDRAFGASEFEAVEQAFGEGYSFTVGATVPTTDYRRILTDIPALAAHLEGESPGVHAATVELILEGLHLHKRLNKRAEAGAAVYSA
ncbi:MAG: sigma 54-interacting transcriptional regulator [Gammaproteobacteria bacterium]|nr:sigma 54-interacting transcriptional regulator [Gammaproteobacteria bacterium]